MTNQSMRLRTTLLLGVLGVALLVSCGAPTALNGTPAADNHTHSEQSDEGATQSRSEAFAFPHIHGLGFSADGKQLLIPAHIGLNLASVSPGATQGR